MDMNASTRTGLFITALALSSFLTLTTISRAQVTFTSNEAQFRADNPGLLTQTFSAGNVAPGDLQGCNTPVDSNSDDACFSPGDILPGIAFSVEPGSGTLLAGPFISFNLNPVKVLTPDGSLQKNVVLFPGNTVFATGLVVGCLFDFGTGLPCTGQALRIEVFGPGNVLIGSTDVITDSLFNTFVGITSDVPIERITLVDADPNPPSFNAIARVVFPGEGFGVPTLSEWGMIALVIVMGAAAMITLRRRIAVRS